MGGEQRVRPKAAGRRDAGTYLCSLRCFSSRTPVRSGPVRGVETAAVSRQHLHTEYLSPFFLGPAHLRTKQVFRKRFHVSVIDQNLKSEIQENKILLTQRPPLSPSYDFVLSGEHWLLSLKFL